MTDAVIVSTARTPIGKAYRGSFNNTHGAELAGHAIAQAVQRAGIDGAEVEDRRDDDEHDEVNVSCQRH